MMRILPLICLAIFKYVNGQCEFQSNSYKATWIVLPGDQVVEFTIAVSNIAPNSWTGIGFGSSMAGGDFVLATRYNDAIAVTDRYGTGYSPPLMDPAQNLNTIQKTTVRGGMLIKFQRQIYATDKNDKSIIDQSLNGCQDFMFPVSGGSTRSQTDIGKHSQSPIVQRICNILSCKAITPNPQPQQDSQCSFNQPGYKATWQLIPEAQMMLFNIEVNITSVSQYWTGIGFGQSMSDGDYVIAIRSPNGQFDVTDRYSKGHTRPSLDVQQDVLGFRGVEQNGVTRLSFQRPINTGDARDKSLMDPSMNNCQYFQFPVGIGRVNTFNGNSNLRQHTTNPVVKLICPSGCAAVTNPPVTQRPIQPILATQAPNLRNGCITVDRPVCGPYVDNYFSLVFGTPNPAANNPRYVLKQQACNMLFTHQGGIVRQSCCNYLNQKCGEFM